MTCIYLYYIRTLLFCDTRPRAFIIILYDVYPKILTCGRQINENG